MESEQLPYIYASGVEISTSPWDVTLRLSIREGDTPKDVRLVATVVLSPQHAKVVAKLLAKNIDAYEQQIGKIELPPRLYNDLGLEP